MQSHVVLLGDSILDNGYYVPGEPAVIEQVRALLLDRSTATLLALDGSTTRDVKSQVGRVPGDATHLILSVGGNDALQVLNQLNRAVSDMGQALQILSQIRADFGAAYRSTIQALTEDGRPAMVCTIYEAIPTLPDTLKTALAIFNDVICREAIRAGLRVIDLREICTVDSDFSAVSPIEPSSQGGAKIASAIVDAVVQYDGIKSGKK